MPKFISDEDMAKMEAEQPQAAPKKNFISDDDMAKMEAEQPSELESGARGIAQGLTMGFADEISGGAEALWEAAKGDPRTFGELYKQYRDESRQNFKKAQEANPGTYTTGEVAGAIGSAFIPGLNVAKGAGLAANVGKAALQGGLMGLGSSEAEDLSGMAKDTATGAALGGAGGAPVS